MTRLEQLQMQMKQEQERKAAASVKPPKVAAAKVKARKPEVKPTVVETTKVVFDPKPTLLEAVGKLSPEDAASPKIVVATIALFLIDELMRCPRGVSALSDHMRDNLTYIMAQTWEPKPNLVQVFARAVMITDGIEFRGGEFSEGEGIKRLHEIDRLLIAKKLGRAQ